MSTTFNTYDGSPTGPQHVERGRRYGTCLFVERQPCSSPCSSVARVSRIKPHGACCTSPEFSRRRRILVCRLLYIANSDYRLSCDGYNLPPFSSTANVQQRSRSEIFASKSQQNSLAFISVRLLVSTGELFTIVRHALCSVSLDNADTVAAGHEQ